MSKPDASWFTEARFGMFVHWGAYSVAARGEWVANRERIPRQEYARRFAENFGAEHYDPAAWAALAREAGMGYMVLTARHHDGFALWPTKTGDFHAGCMGPRRDLVGPFVEAVRAEGLRVGLYYSPADWYHPDYPGAFFRDWPGNDDWESDEARLRFMEYYRSQLHELLTWYGKIDYLWFDGCVPDNLQSAEINEELRAIQPGMLVNERNGPPWDVKISEQRIQAAGPDVLWEACMTLNDNWGWHAGDRNWKSAGDVIRLLTETAAGGGNLLLNVGPRADGSVPSESISVLREVGRWMAAHGEFLRGATRSPFSWNNWGRVTTRGNMVYLHVWSLADDELCFAELRNRVKAASIVGTFAPVPFEQVEDRLFLRALPGTDAGPFTIRLEVEGVPAPLTTQSSFWIL